MLIEAIFSNMIDRKKRSIVCWISRCCEPLLAARPDVPVIMITAYGDDNTRRSGAETLLPKPIDFVALRTEIDGRVARAA